MLRRVAMGSGGGAVVSYPDPDPGPPPPTGDTLTLYPGVSSAGVDAAISNMNIDILEFAAGVYTGLHVYVRQSRAARPLTIRQVSGAAVVFNGGGVGNGWLYLGSNVGDSGYPSTVTDYITIEGAHGGGTMSLRNYRIGPTGLVLTGWVNRVTINDLIIESTCEGTETPQTSHALYVNSDDTHRATNIVADRWIVHGPPSRYMNAVQTYHNPNVTNLTVRDWEVDNVHRWIYADGDAQNIVLSGWVGNDCDATIDSPAGATSTGTISGCAATNCGSTAEGAGVWVNTSVNDGGGNSW